MFLVIIAWFSLVFAQEQEVFNQCVTVPVIGPICIKVTSLDCFQLTGTVFLNNEIVYGPKYAPVGLLLSGIQQRMDDPARKAEKVCQTISLGANLPGFGCSLCSTINDLKVDGDNLHYCGSLTVNCTTPVSSQNFVQTISPPCVDIKNCRLYGCSNNCNSAGTCTALGICKCNEGHYGLDCSVSMDKNCVQSSVFEKTCWKADFPDCHTLDFEIASASDVFSKIEKIDQIDSLSLVPCQRLAENLACELCVSATELHVSGNELIGCPTVRVTCEEVDVSNFKMKCRTMVKSDKLICSDSINTKTNETSIFSNISTGKSILLILSSILGIVFLGGVGYFVITRYFGLELPNPFQQVYVYTEDGSEEPLKMNIQGEEDI